MKLSEIEAGKTYLMEVDGKGSKVKATVVGFAKRTTGGYFSPQTARTVVRYTVKDGDGTSRYRGGKNECPPAQVKRLWTAEDDERVAEKARLDEERRQLTEEIVGAFGLPGSVGWGKNDVYVSSRGIVTLKMTVEKAREILARLGKD